MQQTLIFNFFPLLSGRTAPRRPRPLRFHHLPLELIQLIFEEVVTEFDDNDNRIPTFSDAHTLSFVCKGWRTIVLNTPILWSVVDIHHPPETLDMSLLRAARAPLTLYLSPEYKRPPSLDASWKLYRQFHLFASFSSRPCVADWHILQYQLCSTAPQLQSLNLALGPVGWFESCHLPKNIFGGVQPPHLRELTLDGFSMDWEHHAYLFHNLTALTLAPLNRPTHAEFHHILQNMSSLHQLTLFDSLPRAVHVDSIGIISLPHLRVIEVNDDVRACTSFFQNIKSSLITLKLTLQMASLEEVDGFFQALSTLIHIAPETPWERLNVSVSEPSFYYGRTFKLDVPLPQLKDSDEDVWLHITLQAGRGDDQAVERCVSSAMKYLPLGYVDQLALDVSTRLSSTFWMDVLPSAIPTLHSLRLGKGTMPSFFSAYARFYKAHEVNGAGSRITVPYRSLREVSCDFTARFPSNVKYVLESSWRAGFTFELVHRISNYW